MMPSWGPPRRRLAVRASSISCTQAGAVRVLGVDDWALRKGQTYGTILCDLETGQPVDLLADRTAATLAAEARESAARTQA